MPDSQNPEHVRKLIQEFQLKGANLIPTVTGEIVPTVLVADLTASGPQAPDRLCAGGQIGAAAGVGNQNNIRLINPLGSGTLIIVDGLLAFNRGGVDIITVTTGVGGVGAAQAQFRDTRTPGIPVGTTLRNAAASIVLGPFQYPIGTLFQFFELRWVIGPGVHMRVQQENANEQLTVGFLWRERDLTPGA